MDLGRALATTFTVGSGRKLKGGETDEAEQVGWGCALLGIAILVVAQLGLLFSASGALDGELLRDLTITAFTALAVPFVVFWITSLMSQTTNRLPAAFFYLGIVLAILQVVSGILSSFGGGQTGFVIGLLFAVSFLAAKGFFRIGWAPAVVVGILVVAGFIGASLLLLSLPAGRRFLT